MSQNVEVIHLAPVVQRVDGVARFALATLMHQMEVAAL